MAFFTLLVWARELSQKSSRFLWSHNLKPEKKHLQNDKIKLPFVPRRFPKIKIRKEIQITTKSYKTNGSFGSKLAIFKSAYEAYTAVSTVNLSILQTSGIHQSSVWSHPLRPPWDHSIPLGSRRPSPAGLITVYEHQPKQGQIWKGQFPPKSP